MERETNTVKAIKRERMRETEKIEKEKSSLPRGTFELSRFRSTGTTRRNTKTTLEYFFPLKQHENRVSEHYLTISHGQNMHDTLSSSLRVIIHMLFTQLYYVTVCLHAGNLVYFHAFLHSSECVHPQSLCSVYFIVDQVRHRHQHDRRLHFLLFTCVDTLNAATTVPNNGASVLCSH